MLGNNKARRTALEKQRCHKLSGNNSHNKSVAVLRQHFPTQDPKSSDLHMLHRRKENDDSCLFGDGKSSISELLPDTRFSLTTDSYCKVAIDSSVLEAVETRRLDGFVFKEALWQFKDPRLEETASPLVFLGIFLGKATFCGKMVGMETAVVSAVISGTLKILGNRLASLLIKEYSSIVGVKDDLQELNGLVQEINWWLETTGYKALQNIPSSTWLKKLKDLAHVVDDVVDELQLEAEKHDACGDGGKLTKYMCTKPKSLMLQCKTARKLKAIKKRFAAIVKQRSDVSTITNSLPAGHRHTENTAVDVPTLPIVDEASVLGRDQEKNQIVSKLLEANDQQNIKIVSVIGLGGSGKTTLAKLVFNDVNIIQKHFDVRLWVHVSQVFDVGKLIKKLFDSFAHDNLGQHELPYLCKRISEYLTGKRFLLVLDDVWTESPIDWEDFMVHLKGGNPGSRILLTTRYSTVAETVGSIGTDQFPLPFLSENVSWQLFQQSLIMDANGLEVDFVKVGKEIVNKCGGVPLAVKVLAGSVRGKERIEEWEAMRDENLLYVGDQEHRIYACLSLSYYHLPSYLKPCFTICSVFPKGHNIDKEQLIDLWIAHDMITPVAGVDSLEYSGHKCFNSLVQMSFLQDVVEKNGRVSCRMHDLVHDFAHKILNDEISHAVPQEAASSTNSYRYFSLNNQGRNLLPKNSFEKARAVYVQNSDITFDKSLQNARHLRSIHVYYGNTTVLNTILQIKNLRYLCVPYLACETLPEAISDIWGLQALHVSFGHLLELPKSIGRLRRLRTLNLSYCERLKGLPDSIGDCHMISTINLHNCYELTTLPNSIERNKKLRILNLCGTKIQRLPPGIITLGHLERLDLEDCEELVELPDGMGDLKKLELLNLQNCNKLGSMPVGLGQLPQLQNLNLFVVGESETSAPISELGNIAGISRKLVITNIARVLEPDDSRKACLKQKTNLLSLKLLWGRQRRQGMIDTTNVENGEAIPILDGLEPPTGIKVLEINGYTGGRFAQWMLNKVVVGVQESPRFPCLTRMVLCDFPNLKHLGGLVELPCLEELELGEMPSLESISGGPFPSLVRLEMSGMPSLGEVWMVTERMAMTDGKEEECSSCGNPCYMGRVQIGTCLSYLRLSDCPKLQFKAYMPSSLEKLGLVDCNELVLFSPGQGSSLFSDDADFPSGFAFSCLKKLSIGVIKATTSPSFESECWWELLQYITALESLEFKNCDGLTELPESMRSLTSLRSLHIRECTALCKLPDWLGELQSLQEIFIWRCNSLSSLSPSIQHLTALRFLSIHDCSALRTLPECLGEICSLRMLGIGGLPSISSLPQSLRNLTSLQQLIIHDCQAIRQLPECLGELRSLREFLIDGLSGLICLPQSMGRLASVRELGIVRCPGIKSLPEGIQGLTALQSLSIWGCPDLQRRCERGKEDWHLISHIPKLYLGDSPPQRVRPDPCAAPPHQSCFGIPLRRSGCMWAAHRSQGSVP
ncbi:hypothetical protein ACP70R_048004 [Stipagrostis hirtigluma subsp. patula]